jgi:hypothetical protein
MADKDINIRISTEAQVEGVQEAAAAVEELAGQQTAAAEATREMDEAAEQSDGFKKLFDQQRLQAIGKEVEKLGGTIGELVEGFKETKAGQDFFGGLSDEAKVFGGIAAEVGTSVVQGWAEGGPIGAALAGLNVLVKEVGDSFLAVARAEEQAAADLEAEMDRLNKQTRERKREAASDAIEKQFDRETEALSDQNEKLQEQAGLLKARKALADADFDLKQAQDEAAGKSPDQLAIERVQRGVQQAEAAARQELTRAQDERNVIENTRDAAALRGRIVLQRGFAKDSPEFTKEKEAEEAAAAKLADRERADATRRREIELEVEAARKRAAAELTRIASGTRENQTRDTERRAADEAREREREQARATAEGRTTATRRAGLGREGEGLADSAARAVAGRSERAARGLEDLGDRLASNPTAGAADALGSAVDKLAAGLEGRDAATARTLRQPAQQIERLAAGLKKLETGR